MISIKRVITDLRQDGDGWILLTVSLGWFFFFGVRLSFPVLLPHLRSAFDISLTMAGSLLSVLGFAYAIGQFPGGVISDRVGERLTLAGSTLAATATILIISASPSIGTVFLGTALFGFSMAAFSPTRYTILSNTFEAKNATAISITSASGSVGNTLLPIVAGFLASYTSWQLGFGFFIPAFAAVTLAFVFYLPRESSTPKETVTVISVSTFRDVLTKISTKPILLVTCILLFHSFTWQGFTSFYPSYLVEIKGLSSSIATLVYGLFMGMGVIVKLIAGISSDSFGPRVTILVMLVTVSSSIVLITIVEGLVAIIVVSISLSSMMGVVPIGTAHLITLLPNDIQGSALGFLRASYGLGAGTGPIIVGAIADGGYFDGVFLILAGIVTLGVVLLLALILQD